MLVTSEGVAEPQRGVMLGDGRARRFSLSATLSLAERVATGLLTAHRAGRAGAGAAVAPSPIAKERLEVHTVRVRFDDGGREAEVQVERVRVDRAR